MILANMRISASRHPWIPRTLRVLCGMTRGEPGCMGCEVHQELDTPGNLIYEERWDDWDSLKAHLQSETYTHLLSVLEATTEPPTIEFFEAAEPRGLEYVEAVRLGRMGEAEVGV